MINVSTLFGTLQEALSSHSATMTATLAGYQHIPAARIQEIVTQALEMLHHDLETPEDQQFPPFMGRLAAERLKQGHSLSSLLLIMADLDATIARLAQQTWAEDAASAIMLIDATHAIIQTAIVTLYAEYESSYDELLALKDAVLREISTPIVPIHEGVLVLPLVGAIDSNRAATIMESLLEAITAQQADVIIMDITGVPVIDTGIANYLLQTARAVRLLGSQVILVGISAEIAQTIVQLGIDLTGIATRANLQSGIEYALSLLDLEIMAQIVR